MIGPKTPLQMELGASMGDKQEPRRKPNPAKKCLYSGCGKTFVPARYWQVYCSALHRKMDWEEKHPRVGVGGQNGKATGQ